MQDLACVVWISVESEFKLLKKILKVRCLTAHWIPPLLTDEYKRQREITARELLKLYPKYDKNVFTTFVTGDEKRVHIFELQLKVNNKIRATKNAKHPSVAKHLESTNPAGT